MKSKIQPQRARAIGRLLFQKYDMGKRGALGPKQCYEIFSDFCYRILAINPQPTMEEANSMYDILDENKDKKVTESDFQNLAVKYLCQGIQTSSFFGNNFSSSSVSQNSQISQNNSSSHKSITIQSSSVYQSSNYFKQPQSRPQNEEKKLTVIARKRLDVARRLFKIFDKDQNGSLTQSQIPLIIQETYRQMGQNYQPSKEDVKSYMKMVDTNGDGKITLNQFEQIILRSLKNAGFEIYQ